MAVRDIFKVSRKTFFNPTSWLDLEALIYQNKTIWSVLKGLFTKQTPERTETFDEAMKRQEMSEDDVTLLTTRFKNFALLFFGIGLLIFAYAFYLLFKHHTILGWLLSLAVSIYFFAQAFRYDFWALQLTRRTLGLTFADWKKHWLGN